MRAINQSFQESEDSQAEESNDIQSKKMASLEYFPNELKFAERFTNEDLDILIAKCRN